MRRRESPLHVASPLLACVVALAVVVANAARAGAQTPATPMVPYFGKNLIHYDTFAWRIYTTDHFEIYYYPSIEPHLERVAGYAESAYQQVSADLKHDLSFKVPLIIFKTHSEFEQENVAPGEASGGVLAFAEPERNRMLLPIDEPSDRLYGLITHELTHIFEFDIIPQSLIRRSVPLWVDEGLSDYERGMWDPWDLMIVRDAAIADIIPKMSNMEGYGSTTNVRLVYDLGHAVFEFIESKFGKEGIRQYLFALRKNVIGGGEDAYQEALKMKPDEFDQAFDRYLKDRFKPFRDKERPADYGPDLAPNREKTKFAEALSIVPSPSGDLLAAVTVNRNDQELDIVLLSAKDGSVIRNLTSGFDKDRGFDHIVQIERIENPLLTWGPNGDRIAYFVRTEKERTLIVEDVLTARTIERIPMKMVDEPESPCFSPDGRTIVFAALRGATGDIFSIDLQTKQVTNLTSDDFADYGPTYSPDGTFIVYDVRVSGNQKLFRLDLATKKKTQITFGTNDESAARFIDDHTIVFSSTATDPNVPLDPEVAKNGNIYNIWTLDLQSGELRQYTDVLGGNFSPVVLNDVPGKNRIAFVSYYKGEYSVHAIERKEPLHTVASSDFGAPGPIVDFQAPLQQPLVKKNERKKGTFEKLFLQGRPPISVGVTNAGDIYGGTAITFGDVLGDQQFTAFVDSIALYRTFAFSYVNLAHRTQWAVQAYSQTTFFYGNIGGYFYDPSLIPYLSTSDATATETTNGGSLMLIYPIDRFRRLELSGGLAQLNESYNDPQMQALSNEYQLQTYGRLVFSNGTLMPLTATFVQETTVFREFGPLAGNTIRASYTAAPAIGGMLSRQTIDLDARHYLRIAGTGLLATRLRAFTSWGAFPDFTYFGGDSEMRGYDYLEFIGQNAVFANAELRFPIIEAALTPIGVVGGVRGVFFADVGAGWFPGQSFTFATSKTEMVPQTVGFSAPDPITGISSPIYGTPQQVSGLRLQDGRASYGVGLETFALGFPIHFDWAWRTLFNKQYEDLIFGPGFRQARFQVWIGYDF